MPSPVTGKTNSIKKSELRSFRPKQKSLRPIIEVTSLHTRVTSLHTEVTSLQVRNDVGVGLI